MTPLTGLATRTVPPSRAVPAATSSAGARVADGAAASASDSREPTCVPSASTIQPALTGGTAHDRGGLVQARRLVHHGHREPVVGAMGEDVAGRLAEVVDRAEVSVVLAGHDQHPADRGALVPRLDDRAVADVRDRLAVVDRDRDRRAAALHFAGVVGPGRRGYHGRGR